jgi:predicted unusual protein kinase regulating ubiquinone biosynthesis (AarF/ABC1/UbiB family)
MSERMRSTTRADGATDMSASSGAPSTPAARGSERTGAAAPVRTEPSEATRAAQPEHPVAVPEAPATASPGLSRYTEIARFLIKYRKAGVFKDLALDDKLAEEAANQADVLAGKPDEFVKDLEALGPTFVKIGQTLSTRPDLVPEPYLLALERLQDDVAPVEFATVREILEAELGVRLTKAFETFDEQPLAAASLGQVHAATLRGGRRVVVKIQRPEIAQIIKSDLDVLASAAGAVDRLTDVGKRYRFTDWVDEFRKALSAELDYRLEAENLKRFADNLSGYPRIYIPLPVDDFTSTRVLTMDRVEGQKINLSSALRRTEEPLGELGRDLMRAYLDQVFVYGFIHADPHPGNLLLTNDGRIALIDLGQVVHLPTTLRDQLLKLLLSIMEGHGEDAADVCIEFSTRLDTFDEVEFTRQASRLIAQYGAYEEATPASEGRLVLDLTRLGAALGLRPPPEMTLLGKTFVNLDAALVALDPQIDIKTVVKGHLQAVLMKKFLRSISPQSLVGELIETQELIREAPRRIFMILRMLSDNRFRIHITGLDESSLMDSLHSIANRITAGLVCTGLLLTGAMMWRVPTSLQVFGMPAFAFLMIAIAAIMGVMMIWGSIKDRRAPRESRGPK